MTAADEEDRLWRIREITRVQRSKLEKACAANADDPRFLTGATYAFTALLRIERAAAGETEPERLGIACSATRARPAEPSLFDEQPERPRVAVTDHTGADVTDEFTWRRRGDRIEGTARRPMVVNGRALAAGDVLALPARPTLS